MTWIEQGSCRGAPLNLWFPDYMDVSSVEAETEAKRICASCPSRLECREYGIEQETYGTWGGLSELEREELRSATGRTPMMMWAERRQLTRARRRHLASR